MSTKIIKCMKKGCSNDVVVSISTHRAYCSICREKVYSRSSTLKASHNYRHSKKGKEAKMRDENSVSGRNRARRYLTSEKGWKKMQIRLKKYAQIWKSSSIDKADRYKHQSDVLNVAEEFFQVSSIDREKTFYDLTDNITGHRLRVDGFVNAPKKKIIIEVNGAQHYIPVRFGNISIKRATENLRTYQRRERIKQQYCMDNGYQFICVPFNIPKDMVYSFLQYEMSMAVDTVVVGKEFNFAYSHRLHNELLDDDSNRYIFGKCNNRFGHGHNMKMVIEIKGFIDLLTGMVINFTELKRIVKERVLNKYDHKDLNKDLGQILTTCENNLSEIWNDLIIDLPNLHSIILYETPTSIAIMNRDSLLVK